MPTLNKPKRKKRICSKRIDKGSIYYNNKKWIILRDWKRRETPLCQVCLLNNRTSLLSEIHHITPISTGKNHREREDIAYDKDNIISVCSVCHRDIHKLLKSEPANYWKLMRKIQRKSE